MTDQPNPADIRQFLFEFFSDEELTTLCFDFFPEVHDDFTTGMTKQQKTRMLLEYCQHREVVPNLLGALQRARPEPYEGRFPQVPKVEARPEPTKPVRDPKRVFISHAHEDAEFAHRLVNDLQQHGWRVWIAPDSILPGEKWVEAINRGLEESGVFALVLTSAAVKSRWVISETNAAVGLEHQGKMRFIPLECEPCDAPPLWDAYQRVSFRESYGTSWANLLLVLDPEEAAVRKAREEAVQREVERQTRQPSAVSGVQALEGLKSNSFRARATAVNALAQVGVQFIEPIIGMLADVYPQVRVAAIGALEQLQPTGEWRKRLKYECYVPAGKFIMGYDKSEYDDDRPAHLVNMGAFYIGKYPVTNGEYQRYMQDTQQTWKMPEGKADHPVTNVSWYQACNYARWANMRLLTEAEWEKAASWKGDKGEKLQYPWGDQFDKNKCNVRKSDIWTTTPVGKYSPQGDSPYSCADMAGNVSEWTSSLYKPYPYRADDGREDMPSSVSIPKVGEASRDFDFQSALSGITGPPSDHRVVRGSSFLDGDYTIRCVSRNHDDPGLDWNNRGFRCGVSVVVFPISLK